MNQLHLSLFEFLVVVLLFLVFRQGRIQQILIPSVDRQLHQRQSANDEASVANPLANAIFS